MKNGMPADMLIFLKYICSNLKTFFFHAVDKEVCKQSGYDKGAVFFYKVEEKGVDEVKRRKDIVCYDLSNILSSE
ncbi:hypothetical protein NPIL_169641 [Nephila pilipes]|uniref:Uncharacterized protein n=1 Tax=Nephila pilipes TaxID=299642 RepID=A0A8X6ILL5_NEPPI|nr:hypothetical protein NPIL_169641 [Nephila pilipes]